jgi:hypothetical protein
MPKERLHLGTAESQHPRAGWPPQNRGLRRKARPPPKSEPQPQRCGGPTGESSSRSFGRANVQILGHHVTPVVRFTLAARGHEQPTRASRSVCDLDRTLADRGDTVVHASFLAQSTPSRNRRPGRAPRPSLLQVVDEATGDEPRKNEGPAEAGPSSETEWRLGYSAMPSAGSPPALASPGMTPRSGNAFTRM